MWALLVLASEAATAAGYLAIRLVPGANGAFLQAFTSGAMLTMLADVMMPEAFEHGGLLVGLFTALGFVFAAWISMIQ